MTSSSTAAYKEPDRTGVYVAPFEQLRMTDVESVGGKNASLGEMISQLAAAGVRVPGGFATTAEAFRDFLTHAVNGGASLADRIATRLEGLDIDDPANRRIEIAVIAIQPLKPTPVDVPGAR